MSVSARARWSHDQLPVEEDIDSIFTAPEEGVVDPIDLSQGSEARLGDRLHRLLDQESHLATRDITCEIKDVEGTCCTACPFSQHLNVDSSLGALCKNGREQERVLTELAGLRLRHARTE